MPLPQTWKPTAEHETRAREGQLDLKSEAENFRLHAEAHDRRAANWNAAFTMWLKKARPANIAQMPSGRREEIRDGIRFVNGKPVVGGPDGMTPEQFHAWQDAQVVDRAG